MSNFTQIRVRSRLSKEAVDGLMAKIPTERDYDVLLKGPTKVYNPEGKPLCIYLPGAVKEEMDEAYAVLTTIRASTENRGYASGTQERVIQRNQRRGVPVTSALLGSFEASGYYKFCRLTSWSSKQLDERWPSLFPLFESIAQNFAEHIPDRYEAQMKFVRRTPNDWLVGNTPFTTITVNNSYSTGAHRDIGDLDEGFSCLAVARKGSYYGGLLTFPEYRVAADLRHGDMILMDAHEVHCNTQMGCTCKEGTWPFNEGHAGTGPCKTCGAERISVVCYYRTKMASCGTSQEENAKALAWSERVNAGA
jgi:hypothetical protein